MVTWGVRSITGALLAGLTFALFPQLFSQYHWLIVVVLLLILFGMANQSRAGMITAGVLLAVGLVVYFGFHSVTDTITKRVGEVPTTLFGFGAIMVAREPRGVLYDAKNAAWSAGRSGPPSAARTHARARAGAGMSGRHEPGPSRPRAGRRDRRRVRSQAATSP